MYKIKCLWVDGAKRIYKFQGRDRAAKRIEHLMQLGDVIGLVVYKGNFYCWKWIRGRGEFGEF